MMHICCLCSFQVGLAKVNSAGTAAKALVFQDLTIGLGDAVQNGDSVEVKYTGWLYSGRSFGDVSIPSNHLSVKGNMHAKSYTQVIW